MLDLLTDLRVLLPNTQITVGIEVLSVVYADHQFALTVAEGWALCRWLTGIESESTRVRRIFACARTFPIE